MSQAEMMTDDDSLDRAQRRVGTIMWNLTNNEIFGTKKDKAFAKIAHSAIDHGRNSSSVNKLSLGLSRLFGKVNGLTNDDIFEAERLAAEYVQNSDIVQIVNDRVENAHLNNE